MPVLFKAGMRRSFQRIKSVLVAHARKTHLEILKRQEDKMVRLWLRYEQERLYQAAIIFQYFRYEVDVVRRMELTKAETAEMVNRLKENYKLEVIVLERNYYDEVEELINDLNSTLAGLVSDFGFCWP